MKTLIFIGLLASAALCQVSGPTLAQSSSVLASIKTGYNAQTFVQLYTQQSAPTVIQLVFTNFLTTISANSGPFNYETLINYQAPAVSTGQFTYTYVVYFTKSHNLALLTVNLFANGTLVNLSFEDTTQQQSVQQFMNANALQASLTILQGGNTVASFAATRIQPIDALSTVPLVFEYVRQVQASTISASTKVNLADVKKFYIPKIDSGFANFLSDATAAGSNTTFPLSFIAVEMTQYFLPLGVATPYPSQALQEYLQNVVTLASVNKQVSTLGITQSQGVYPVSSYLAFTNMARLSKKKYSAYIVALNANTFYPLQANIHATLVAGGAPAIKLLNNARFSVNKRLLSSLYMFTESSTSQQYANLFNKMNAAASTLKYTAAAQQVINPVAMVQFFESNTFTSDAGIVAQSRNLFVAGGYAQLKTAQMVSGVSISDVSYTLLVQSLTSAQKKLVLHQLNLIVYLISSNPTFNVDFASGLNRV